MEHDGTAAKSASVSGMSAAARKSVIGKIGQWFDSIGASHPLSGMRDAVLSYLGDESGNFAYCAVSALAGMLSLRAAVDGIEGLVPHERWPMPTYAEMFFLT